MQWVFMIYLSPTFSLFSVTRALHLPLQPNELFRSYEDPYCLVRGLFILSSSAFRFGRSVIVNARTRLITASVGSITEGVRPSQLQHKYHTAEE